MIEREYQEIPISRQCEIIGLLRASYYYKPGPDAEEEHNRLLMWHIDEQFTKTPFYGSRNMTTCLKRQGHKVNRKRIRRLMNLMGLEAIFPKPNLSKRLKEHKKYPYLLRDIEITRRDQVWSTDITYIRLKQGFIYLVAVIDWYSRYVLAWEISTTLDKEFCMKALNRALEFGKPEIFNTDQGVQFTSLEFTGRLEAAGIQISMDGRGRALDNVFVERLWRSVKYEEVYLKDYQDVRVAKDGLGNYFQFYNAERPHQSLDDATPSEVYYKELLNTNTKAGYTIH
jgi:putative transposase